MSDKQVEIEDAKVVSENGEPIVGRWKMAGDLIMGLPGAILTAVIKAPTFLLGLALGFTIRGIRRLFKR